MAKITQLWDASERHTAKFATSRGAIAYVQCGSSGCMSTKIITMMMISLMRRTMEMVELLSS